MSAAGLAHLIGSVPLATTEEVFRRLAASLGPVLSRMPDGETGERRRWIYWQRTMLERHPAMEVDADAGLLELRQWDGSLLRRTDLLRFRPGVDPDSVVVPDRLRGGRARVLGRLHAAPPRGRGAAGAALPGLPAHRHVERLHVREPARARRLPAGLRALAAPGARRHRGRHPPRRAQHPVGHLPGGAGVRELLPVPPRRLQDADLRPARAPGGRGARRRRARLSPLLRQPGRPAPGDADRRGRARRAHPRHRRRGAGARSTSSTCRCRASGTTPRTSRPCAGCACPSARASTWGSSTTTMPRATGGAWTPRAPRWASGFGVATECGWGRGEPARLDGLLESHRRAVDYLLAGAAR